MKRKVIIFIIITLVVLVSIFIGSRYILGKNEVREELTQLSEAIKREVIKLDNRDSLFGSTFKDGLFYYVESKEINDEKGKFYLNTYDVKKGQKKSTKISDNQNLFCHLDKYLIVCSDEKYEYIYDLSLKKLKERRLNSDTYFDGLIKYKNEYYEYFNGELRKDKEKIKIPSYDDTFMYEDYIIINDNTYLLFSSSGEYYIYDIKNNSLINTHEEQYFKYDDGYIFYSSTYYHLYDLKNNKDMKYDVNGVNSPKTEYYGTYQDHKIYQISNATKVLEVYNIKKDKITSLDLSEYINYSVKSLFYFDNLICLMASDDSNIEFIKINIDNIPSKYVDVYEYLVNQNKEMESMIKKIKEDYNVNIKIKDKADIEFPDFTSQAVYNNAVINLTIKRVESILKKFPSHFFANFTHDDYKGLNIYLGSNLKPVDPSTQANNPVAYTLMLYNTYMIVLDSHYSELENTVCHEIMHAMEKNLINKNKAIFTRWNKLNPRGFSYYGAYNNAGDYEYIPFMTNDKNVYFVSAYSYTFDNEDRAEIFGKMCSEETNEDIKKYPNLYKKAQAIKEELIANYPELKNSIVLKNY